MAKTCLSESSPALTIGALVRQGQAYLERHGIESSEAQMFARTLVSERLQMGFEALSLHADDSVDLARVEQLRGEFLRLARGEPLQYLIGHWPFHDIELKVDARALIPRPETELLVERILHDPIWQRAEHIADIGTGTGAIILSLAHAARGAIPPKSFTAVDLSPDALALAGENAAALGLQVDLRLGNGCAPLAPNSMDIIVSNPPYIASRTVDALPPLILDHEPRTALDGGADGLDILRQITLEATQVLRPGGKIFFEMGDDQGLAMQRILDRAGFTDVVITKDYAQLDRMAEGTLR